MAKTLARKVAAEPAVVTHHHPNITDWYDRLGNQVDGGEPAVDEIGPVGEWLILAAATAAGAQKRFRILKVVVVIRQVVHSANGRRNNLARSQ